ncbi:selenium-binding protein SBP56-related protein [Micromonospora chokoriensis]
MTRWTPDPTFYPSPREAVTAPAEKLAYVAAFDRTASRPDAIVVLDTDPDSPVAMLVYQVLGVGVLRRAWFNVDRLWAGVLVAARLVTVLRA